MSIGRRRADELALSLPLALFCGDQGVLVLEMAFAVNETGEVPESISRKDPAGWVIEAVPIPAAAGDPLDAAERCILPRC